jgi:hypothetical protein
MSAVVTVPRLVQVAPAAVGEPVMVTPEMVGEVPKTSAPEPVSSPTIPMSSDDASIDVVPSAVELIEEPVSAIWYPAESAFCLLLKVVQSAAERRPRTVVAPAVGMLRVCVLPDEVIPKPPATDEDAKVWVAPVWPPSEVMPPAGNPSVVVDTH